MPAKPEKKDSQKKRPLSYSKFWTYTDCPLQYKLTYIDKIPEAPRPEYSMGRSIHKTIELFHKRGPSKTTLEDMMRLLDRAWDPQGFPTSEDERRFKRAAKAIMTNFYKDASRTYRAPLGAEIKFDMEIDGVPFTGRIDAIEPLDDGTLEVLDYKSGEEPISEERVRGNVQLGIYQMAAEAKYGKTVSRITIYHLRSRKRVSAPAFSEEMKADLRRAIVTAASCIDAGVYDPRLSGSCPCDYPEYCPYFKDKEEYRGPGQGKLVDDYDRTGLTHDQIDSIVREYSDLVDDGKGGSERACELEAKMLTYCTEHDVLRLFVDDITITLVYMLDPAGESYSTFAIGRIEKDKDERAKGDTVARQDEYV